jgi:NADH dehydrogenase
MSKKVIIIGGGFGGLNAAKGLGNVKGVEVLLIDRKNHHLFQPLLYQVATAELSPGSIAQPLRKILAGYDNVSVIQGEVLSIDREAQTVTSDFGVESFDYLVVACGAMHSYFGNNQWEEYAPGLKTLEQSLEIRRRVLTAFELAEKSNDPEEQRRLLTFAVVGAGPTGVEMAGAIAEMARHTLKNDFSNIDSRMTKVYLIEAGPRILPAYKEKLAWHAHKDLESLGVEVLINTAVTNIDADGVELKDRPKILTPTVVWGAGIQASELGKYLTDSLQRGGRVAVGLDCATPENKNIFVLGDQCWFTDPKVGVLPTVATVAIQMGSFLPKVIRADFNGQARPEFKYWDKGQMAIIGRSKAIAYSTGISMTGFIAWVAWLLVHVYFLVGLKNRAFVMAEWSWHYFTQRRDVRLITTKEWRHYLKKA